MNKLNLKAVAVLFGSIIRFNSCSDDNEPGPDPVQWGEPEIKWFTISIPDFVVSANGSFNLPTMEKTPGVNWNANLGRGVLHGDKFIMGTVYYDFDGNFSEETHAIVL